MAPPQLSIDTLPTWATLQDVKLQHVGIRHIEGKGYGLAAEKELIASQDVNDATEIMRIPAALVLSGEAVGDYTKVDQHFKQLIEADALEAKTAALENEFHKLRDSSAALPFWNNFLWEVNGATLADWLLADAWYRSRCLELPQASHAMVPALDMVNHSASATAYYEEETSGSVSLRIRPGTTVPVGEEINISYGDSKSAAEMLFSYGFIDPDCKTRQLTLHLESFPDDPLAMAKQRVFGEAPVVTLRQIEGDESSGKAWESSFVYLMCLNEEDGLDFRILQDDAGDRQLRLFWQEEDVTEQANDFETLLQDHPLQALFQLRAVSVVQERAASQLEKLEAAPSGSQLEPLVAAEIIDEEHVNVVSTLKDIERTVLEAVVAELEEEKSRLVEHESVVAYFGSMEDDQNELAQDDTWAPANDEVDFS
ncbi:hypothetical protein PWT90_03734 [Aphanocladium album]|nr:hypothetical protein PWT90_03734 [Aphanocladium album]